MESPLGELPRQFKAISVDFCFPRVKITTPGKSQCVSKCWQFHDSKVACSCNAFPVSNSPQTLGTRHGTARLFAIAKMYHRDQQDWIMSFSEQFVTFSALISSSPFAISFVVIPVNGCGIQFLVPSACAAGTFFSDRSADSSSIGSNILLFTG